MKDNPRRGWRTSLDNRSEKGEGRKARIPGSRFRGPAFRGWRLLFCAILLAPLPRAEAGQKVSVSGRVINRTRNTPVPGLVVALVQHHGESARQVKTVSGSDGGFHFSEVALDDSASFGVMTSYLGAPYVVSNPQLKSGLASDVEVVVFDTTSSEASIRADAYHLIINAHGPAMDVMEILSLRNEGDRTIVGANGASLRIPLPVGFSGLEAESAVSSTSEGLACQWPFPPGEARLRFQYKLPEGKAFTHVIPYPTAMVSVLVHPPELSVESGSLQVQGPVDFGEQRFLHLTGVNLPAGKVIDFRVTGMGTLTAQSPQASGNGRREALKWTLLALAAATGGAAVFFRPKRRRQDGGGAVGPRPSRPRASADGGNRLEEQREKVLGQIATLDDDREAGRMDEETYLKRRDELKAEAVRLTVALGNGNG